MVLARGARLLGQHKKNSTIVATVVNATNAANAAIPPAVKHQGGLNMPAFLRSATNLELVGLIVGSVVGILCVLALAISLVSCALQQRQRRGYETVIGERQRETNGNIVIESSVCDLYSNGTSKDLPLLTLPGSAEQGRG